MVKTLFVIVQAVVLFQLRSNGQTIYQNHTAYYGDTVYLQTTHGDDLSRVVYQRWKIDNDTYYKPANDSVGVQSITVIQKYGPVGTPIFGGKFTDRVTIDYKTGSINISDMQCYEDQEYCLEYLGPPAVNNKECHTITLLGK